MENRVYLQPAYVLHKQAFQNSSLLIDFFCVDYGRVRAVARGARRASSKYRSILQIFQPLLVSLSGKGDVKTVTSVESSVTAIDLTGDRLFSGLYLNELITRIVLSNVEHSTLYYYYQEALIALRGDEELTTTLRRFELSMLDELGYGVNLDHDCVSREPILADEQYLFTPDRGFELAAQQPANDKNASNVFEGKHIQELRELTFSDEDSKHAAKRVLRLALQAHLGEKPLHSRSLFAYRA